MRRAALLLAILSALLLHAGAGARADEEAPLSCAELAERRAARQYAEDSAALEDRQAGGLRDSALQRDLLRLDADSYRARVYEDCLKQRRATEPSIEPAPGGD